MSARKSPTVPMLRRVALLAGPCLGVAGAVAVAGGGADLEAQQANTVTITGHIRDLDTGSNLEGAVLELSGLVHRHVTGADGRATFSAPTGNYTLTIRRAGYVTLRGGFRVIRPGDFSLSMRKGEAGDQLAAPARLLVRVVDAASGAPVEGAAVSVLDGRRGFTDAGGRATFGGLQSDLTTLTVERIGYATREEPIALHPDQTTVAEVAMTVEAVALRPITVEVRSRFLEARGFYRRLDDGIMTRLLTRQTIEERGSPRISDAFARVPGLRINRPSTDRAFLQARDWRARDLRRRRRVERGHRGDGQHRPHPPGMGRGGRSLLGLADAPGVPGQVQRRLRVRGHLDTAGGGQRLARAPRQGLTPARSG